MNIDTILNDIYIPDFAQRLDDYDSDYICDAITEIADSEVDIYTYDLWEWARHNTDWCEEAVSEYGDNIVSNGFEHVFQVAQYLAYFDEIWRCLDDCIKYVAYVHYNRTYGEEITEEQHDMINDALKDIDGNDRVNDIYDAVDALFAEKEE